MGFKNSFKTGFGFIIGLYSGLMLVGLIQSKANGDSSKNEDKEEEDKES